MATIGGVKISTSGDLPNDHYRVLIHGPQGSGKTSLASTIARVGKTLMIDLTGERGTRSFRGAPYEKNIEVVRPSSVTAIDDIYWALDGGDHDYKAVILDSTTALQKMTMRYLLGHDETAVREIKQGTAPADMRTWGQALDVMTDTFTFWYGLADAGRADQGKSPLHVVMTAQTKVNEDDFGNVTRAPDVQKGALSFLLATPDYVLYTDTEENVDAIGDDSQPPVRHIARFGAHPDYRTKARIPVHLRGKIPSVLGRGASAPDLAALGQRLEIGGIPAPKKTSDSK